MHIDDITIRSIVEKYQAEMSYTYANFFIEQTCFFIQHWPKIQFSCDEDVCQDFLVYILERIDTILLSFPLQTEVLFKTWFSGVLYHKFVDFVKAGSVKVDMLSIEDDIVKVEDQSVSTMFLGSYFDIELVLEKLSYEDQSLLMFYYFPEKLTPDHLNSIADSTQKNLYDILFCYQELMQEQNKNYDQKQLCQKKLDKIDSDLAHMYNILKKNSCKDISVIENKIARFKNKRDKYLRYLRRMNQGFMKVFSQLFIDYNTAYRKIRNLERKIKQIMLN